MSTAVAGAAVGVYSCGVELGERVGSEKKPGVGNLVGCDTSSDAVVEWLLAKRADPDAAIAALHRALIEPENHGDVIAAA